MPRIRSIPPDVCELEALTRVSPYADRTFLRLWTEADDYGRAKDDPRILVAHLYPLDDRMTAERVERDLAELAAEGLVHRYVVEGQRYLCIDEAVWAWQKPRRKVPSKLPPWQPPDNVRTQSDNRRTCTAGGGDGGGVGDGDGVTPNSRIALKTAEPGLPQPVDISRRLPLQQRAARIAAATPPTKETA